MGERMSVVTNKFTAEADGTKIRIRGPYNSQMNEFYRSLPAARWDRLNVCWMCMLTPASAWRVASAPVEFVVDETIEEMASDFGAQIKHGELILTKDDLPQPTKRVHDAWNHQIQAYWFSKNRTAALLAMWMGTGKSKVTVDLLVNSNARRVLIICPTSVRAVWRREFAKHSPVDFRVLVLDGSQSVKRKASMAAKHLLSPEPCVVVINYEAVFRKDFLSWATSVEWDAVVTDESHRIKGAQSKTSKACYEIGKSAKRRLALTGTPMSHSPMDLFGQFRFLDPGIFGTSYHRFRSQFAVSGHFGADHIVGFKNQDELAEKMALITYQVGPEVLDLPPVQHIEIPITLGKKARAAYDSLAEEMCALVEDGVITVSNALVKLLRLSQITSGYCVDDDETEHEFEPDKLRALTDILEGIDKPCVVFCRFVRDLAQIRDCAESLGKNYGEISGRQKDLTEHATMPEGIDVMGVQVQSGGVGIDLTAAPYCVWFNHPWSLGGYDQALTRVHRPGQTQNVTYYHLLCEGTVDVAVFAALGKKRDIVEKVLSYLGGESL
jgi:SNF2 family DNA or RNA helicase